MSRKFNAQSKLQAAQAVAGPSNSTTTTRNTVTTATLVPQKSEFGANVTLFTLDDLPSGGSGGDTKPGEEERLLRRSPRKRVKREEVDESLSGSFDIEDAVVPASNHVGVSPLVALRNRLHRQGGDSDANANGPKGKGKGRMSTLSTGIVKKEEGGVKEEGEAEKLALQTKGLLRFTSSSSPLSSAPPSPSSTSRKLLDVNVFPSTSAPLPTPSPTKKKGKAKAIPTSLATPHPAPEHWEEVYELIKDMRSRIVAPVDTMGCDQAQFKESEPKNRRFATLVSLMLSSQTKDEVTDAAVTKLREAVGGTLSIENVIAAPSSAIAEAINKVGFWRRKTDYIKQTAEKLRTNFGSDVPKTVDELCSLPGVGPKMAFLALQVAWDLNLGIGVDVHVHRITNRLGWHAKPTKGPEETRLNLQSWLPKDKHKEINHMLVGFGQIVCLPVNPKCGECVLSEKGLCPSARVNTKKAGGRKRKVKEEVVAKIEVKVELETSNFN